MTEDEARRVHLMLETLDRARWQLQNDVLSDPETRATANDLAQSLMEELGQTFAPGKERTEVPSAFRELE